jgi:pyruvate formate lyase activating enzyme
MRDSPFYAQSSGGVTFSGGEPTSQPDFLLACLSLCRAHGLHTALDTCGYVDHDLLSELLPLVDLFLYDIKLVDDGKHRLHTGVPAQPIIDNLRSLDAAGAEIWVRTPLVPGVNDVPQDMKDIGSLIANLEHTRRLHLLPHHGFGAAKKQRVSQSQSEEPVAALSRDSIEAAAHVLTTYGLDLYVGG